MPRLAVAALAALTILHTWPLALAGRASLDHHADAQLNAWIIAWVPHALATQPLRLFDGNIFAPEPNTLAYSEPLIVPALLGAPLVWAGVNPAVVLTMLTVAGLLATACAAAVVAWRWTGHTGAAIVAGALVAFNVHLLTRIAHLAAVHAWGLPLTLYYADALGRTPTRRTAVALLAVLVLTAATSLYWFALAGIIAFVVLIASPSVRGAAALAATGTVALLCSLPILLPYAQLAAGGSMRPIEMVREFSATMPGYLRSTAVVHGGWVGPIANDVDVLFPGLAAAGLAIAGAIGARSLSSATPRRTVLLAAIAAIGIVLSMGPATWIYRAIYDSFPPMRGLRAAARFGFLALMATAFLAAFAVARFGRTRRAVPAAAIALVTIEAWHGPVRTAPVPERPAIYTLLRDAAPPVLLAEVPFYPGFAALENARYVFNSTLHWRPLMNGYSGFTPQSYRQRADVFWFFPDAAAIDAMKRDGVTHVMVHLDRFGGDAVPVMRTLESRGDLELVAADAGRRRLYRFRR